MDRPATLASRGPDFKVYATFVIETAPPGATEHGFEHLTI